MKRVYFILFLLLVPFTLPATAQIIPQPREFSTSEGTLTIDRASTVYTNLKGTPRKLMLEYLATLPVPLKADKSQTGATVVLLQTALTDKGAEAYELSVTPKRILVKANTDRGLFYAIQSLLQLSDAITFSGYAAKKTSLAIPCAEVKDSPRFPYRGFMLDVSRHFFNKEFVMRQLDLMAYYKLNTFHFHLVDNGGWRLEMKKYPQLTEQAAYRVNEPWPKHYNHWDFCPKGTPGAYGGYYTQDDIRQIVAHAAKRHITVIPEFDMPGHSNDVLKALPELACKGFDYKTSQELCIGKEATFAFCADVLKEAARLFPGEYIHIGGDEAAREHWAKCPDCQKRMQEEGIKDVAHLQGYFTKRIEKIANSLGKHIIGWDEILDGEVSKSATVMAWHPLPSCYKKPVTPGMDFVFSPLNATAMGHKAIMTPISNCYLDYVQDEKYSARRGDIFYLPLADCYNYEPLPQSVVNPELVLGVQGNLWTEGVPTNDRAEYMAYPRLMALAEVGWTQPQRKSYPDFYSRMQKARRRMQQAGINTYDDTADMNARCKARRAQHVVLIGIDGFASASIDSADVPTIKHMMQAGCYTLKKRSVLPSASAINWASMMMGSMTEVAGYTQWNSKKPEIPPPALSEHGIFPTLFTEMFEQYPTDFTACVYDWDGIRYVIDTAAVTREIYYPDGKTDHSYPSPDGITAVDCRVIKASKPALMFCYFGCLDEMGHNAGWYTPEYYDVEKQIDACIAKIVQATKDAGIYDDTVFIITGDHGGNGKRHGGITLKEMESPFIAFGKGIRQSGMFHQLMTQADVAPTIAAILNLNTPPYWTGRAQTQIFK